MCFFCYSSQRIGILILVDEGMENFYKLAYTNLAVSCLWQFSSDIVGMVNSFAGTECAFYIITFAHSFLWFALVNLFLRWFLQCFDFKLLYESAGPCLCRFCLYRLPLESILGIPIQISLKFEIRLFVVGIQL